MSHLAAFVHLERAARALEQARDPAGASWVRGLMDELYPGLLVAMSVVSGEKTSLDVALTTEFIDNSVA